MTITLFLSIAGNPDIYDGPGNRCGLQFLYYVIQFLKIMLVGVASNLIVFVVMTITALKKREHGLIFIGIIPLLNILTLIKENHLPKWLTVIYIITMLPWILFSLIIFLSFCISNFGSLNPFL